MFPGRCNFPSAAIMVDYGKGGEPIYSVPDIFAAYYLAGDYSEFHGQR